MSSSVKIQIKKRRLESWVISKEELAQDWEEQTIKERNKKYKQGQVVMCEFGENLGYEMSDWRPVLVISDSWLNSAGQLVVVPLTKNTRPQKTHYTLRKTNYKFLSFDSCVKTEQIKSVSTIRLRNVIGEIETTDLKRVKIRLKTLFGL